MGAPILKPIHTIAIIGCGGVTSFLITAIMHSYNLHLYDGDTFEPKNTVRQIGAFVGDGKNKAETYVEMFGKFAGKEMKAFPFYISDSMNLDGADLIIAAVDNHDARIALKAIADRQDIPLIWAANEEEDPEAFLYLPEWEGTNWDPYVRMDIKPDGRSPMGHCTTQEAIEAAPQLPIANHNAASLALWLLNALTKVSDVLNMPAEVRASRNGINMRTFKQIDKVVAKPADAVV